MHSGSHIYDYIHHVCTGLLFAPLLRYASADTVTYIWIGTLVLWWVVGHRRQKRWRTHLGGEVAPGFEKVREAFRALLESRQERGGAFCVYHRGQPVVDIWGGYADYTSMRPRSADSTQMLYSVSKAVTAITMAVLVDRGLLDYDAPVSKYWPEFAAKGKERIDVKTLLSHQAGLITIQNKHKLALVRDDPEMMGKLLAEQKPMWTPGQGQGYHTLTFGLYADQLVRRVDPYKRNLSKFFQMEIARPFGLEIWIGEPKEQFHRACRETRAYFGLLHFLHTMIPTAVKFVACAALSVLRWGRIYLLCYVGNPTDWLPRRMNCPDFRDIPSPASHAYGTAHAVAKLMAILASGGALRGQRLLSADTYHRLTGVLTDRWDRVVLRKVAYGPGLMVEKIDVGKQADEDHIGHWGAGGQMAYFDPKRELAWAYCTNYSNVLHGFVMDHRYVALKTALYECMESYDQEEGRL